MEPWQKLMQALCEIWIEEDIKSGKLNYEQENEENITIEQQNKHEVFCEAA